MNEKIRFKDLSIGLKLAVFANWLWLAWVSVVFLAILISSLVEVF